MRKFVMTLGFVLALPGVLSAQKELEIDHDHSCCYSGELDRDIKLYSFENDAEARLTVERIMAYSGLEPNFVIMAANVPNASAVVQKGKRLILYSQEFMERIKNDAKTDWAAYAIMAHEVGHHLQGHTLTQDGSRPHLELQADKYSGYVLGLMGASLDEAISALKTLRPGPGSVTHPSRSARLAAGANGWKKAQETLNGVPKETPASEPVPAPSSGNETIRKLLTRKLPTTGDIPKIVIKVPSKYSASIGVLGAEVQLAWNDDGRVTGGYTYSAGLIKNRYTLTGSNPEPGLLLLEENNGSQVSGRWTLRKSLTEESIIWKGTVRRPSGIEVEARLVRPRNSTP